MPFARDTSVSAPGLSAPGLSAPGLSAPGLSAPGVPDPGDHDPFGASLALGAPEPLATFNRAGVLAPADVHVARTLARMAEIDSPEVLLGVALAVRAPRLGHVYVDLERASETVVVEDAPLGAEEGERLRELPWPEPARWPAALAGASQLVALGDEEGADEEVRPLRLIQSRLYLDRYWREERRLAAALATLARKPIRQLETVWLYERLRTLFPRKEDALQRAAAASIALRGLAVVAGGPGTGKTTTVARALALLLECDDEGGGGEPLIALCAPTGKAASRLEQAVHQEAAEMQVDPAIRARLLALRASTIHRLLGWRPGAHARFRHHASNPLPHDLVIVDETSMVSLSLMDRLFAALRDDARAVLVGDPDQLSAIEAGAVLRDIVGEASEKPRLSRSYRALLSRLSEADLPEPVDSPRAFGDAIVPLSLEHRFGAGIGRLAREIRAGDVEAVLQVLRAGGEELTWVELAEDAGRSWGSAAGLRVLREAAVQSGRLTIQAARSGDAGAAIASLGGFRLLCAHRHGPYGVESWSQRIEEWLAEALDEPQLSGKRDYAGRPLLVTRNDYELGLYNGDTGVIVESSGSGPESAGSATASRSLVAAFLREGEQVAFAPSRLSAVQTLHAMTIHKSQGSQFDTAAVLLPAAGSRILTRELLYTAVTRARTRLLVLGSAGSIEEAVARPVARASGLRERLWSAGPEDAKD